ncbi:AAA family ATPase [Nonomuraea phyllanthi]|uniref:helix-turn-helix transcriptional regulator n=1 Tax=Nonomuraea phyllanthi TaxID=2219224 RepID=UPI0012939219|nr:LuxR family transcriptional regulator [Nonomuraea phyllanthi]QFY10234.1 AAA family ATPase [Nonomuraea phyllanthi]
MLYGRSEEQTVITRLLDDAGNGVSGALIVRGAAGVGKSALLDQAAVLAGDRMLVLRGAGIQPEMELPFAGLHLLLHSVLDGIDALPTEQARALRGALGLERFAAGDRFLVGLAVLTLLANTADERPLVCLIDDAHWLDQASAEALLFAARRLDAEGVVLVFAARDDEGMFDAPGVRELQLRALEATAAEQLLDSHAPDLAPEVRRGLLAEAEGNPLALIELPATLTGAQRSGELPLHAVGMSPVPSRILRSFHERIAALPAEARTLLLVAACDDGTLDLVLDAIKRLGGSLYDAEPAEAAGLVRIADGRIAFRHPLVRTAAYQHAPAAARQAAHRALAESLDGHPDAVGRMAWHLALATTGSDEAVAAALERGAEQAESKGGHAGASAAYERAAQLTPHAAERGRRLAAAARAAAELGQYHRAGALADRAAPDLSEPLESARLAQVRAAVATARGDLDTAHTTLSGAADAVREQGADDLAAEMYFDAITAAWLACDFAAVTRTATRAAGIPRAHPLLRAASGLGRMAAEEPPVALSSMREVIEGLAQSARPADLRRRAALALWDLVIGDDTAAYHRAVAIERESRTSGAVGVLPMALVLLARAQMFMGRYRDSLSSAQEGYRIARDIGQHHHQALLTGIMTYVAAAQGDEERCQAHAAEIADVTDGATSGIRCAALNLLDLAGGRHEAIVRRALEFDRHSPAARTMMVLHRTQDVVEAAVRLDRTDLARTAAARVQASATATGQPWAQAVALRCRALLASAEEAGDHFEQAVRLHQQGGRPLERARTELLYGEWLRRNRRKLESRQPLESALEIFQRLDARPWTDRTQGELRAAGKRHLAANAPTGLIDQLTAQELQIVRLAALGMSNKEIAAQLFLSPRTIGYHLHKAFPKLQVASRGELAQLALSLEAETP